MKWVAELPTLMIGALFCISVSQPCFATLNIVLLGAPGSGKGALSTKLVERYRLPHFSTGDFIRDEMRKGTPFGLKVKELKSMSGGHLLPDTPEYMGKLIEVVAQRISEPDCASGFILDGFPRTEWQAQELDRILKTIGKRIDAAVLLEVSNETVIKRLSNRMTCPHCKRSYNNTNFAPNIEGVCDKCDEDLIVRDDDKPESVLTRLEAYGAHIGPIVDYYTKLQQLVNYDGEADASTEFKKLTEFLDKPYPRAYLQGQVQKQNLMDMFKDAGLIRHIVDTLTDKIISLNPDMIVATGQATLPVAGALIVATRKPVIVMNSPDESAPSAVRGKTVVLVQNGISSGAAYAASVKLLERAGAKVIHGFGLIRHHSHTVCEEFLNQGLEAKTTTLFDLN